MSTSFNLFDPNDSFGDFGMPATPTDGCTQCGICLSSCPTFKVTQDVNQSPMGRIRLMREMETMPGADLPLEHLESCLGCYSCEQVCPSRVQFGELLDQALSRVREHRPMPATTRFMLHMATHPGLLRVLTAVTAVLQCFGVRWLIRKSGLLKLFDLARADRLLNRVVFPLARVDSTVRRQHPEQRVALFTGCFSSVLEQDVQQSAIDVLNALGIEVVIPKQQVCCGALHQHNGETEQAAELARKNIAAFDEEPVAAIVSTSSGCGATLKNYSGWTHNKVMDISHYLAQVLEYRKASFRPLPLRVAVHMPCTLKQVEGQVEALQALLGKIPGLDLVQLSGSTSCCGAGGSQVLAEPEIADALRDEIVHEVVALKPDVLLSANLGCALHLQSGLQEAGIKLPLLHPIQLLEQALSVEFVSVGRN